MNIVQLKANQSWRPVASYHSEHRAMAFGTLLCTVSRKPVRVQLPNGDCVLVSYVKYQGATINGGVDMA